MRLTILALGSRGDVQPYTALGKGLLDAGYHVRVATFASFEGMVRGQGLDFHPIPGDAEALVNIAASAGLTETRNPLRMMRAIQRSYGQLVEDYIEGFSASELHDSDVIIDQLPGGFFGRDLAEKLRIPHVVAAVIPAMPTRAFPVPLLMTRSRGALLNRASYTFASQAAWLLFRSGVSKFRRRLGLSPAPLLLPLPPDTTLCGFSEHVVPRPPDWGAHVHVTGYWLLQEPDWQPPADLLGFLEAGAPPVFIGFGSMPVKDPQKVTQTLLDALRISGARAVLSRGWAKLGDRALPDNIYAVDYAPYEWLFPRMAAVVHHGGSGTTGLALRGGVPSMVVPFTADQPYWGTRTAALGVGHPPIPIQTLTADNLADALTTMINSAEMRTKATALSTRLRGEDGIARAVAIIRETVGAPTS